MGKVGLDLMDLNKENFRRTFDSLQKDAHSLLLLTFQWKEIESYFDLTKTSLKARAEELEALEESIKGRALDLEKKEKEFCSIQESITQKSSDLERKEKEIEKRKEEVEEFERCTKRIADENAKVKELLVLQEEKISGQEKLRVQFEPLISFLAKNISCDTTMPANCSGYDLNENAIDLAEKNAALAGVIEYLDPAKLVLDAIKGSVQRYLGKDYEEPDDSVVNSWIVLLEKVIPMNLKIRSRVKEEAMQLGTDLIGKAQTNLDNYSWVLGCLLFLAMYGLASLTSREVILSLLRRVLLYDQAPKLFGILGLQDEVSGVVKILKEKEEYWAAIKFMCELRLFKLHPGGPGRLLVDYLNASEKSARAMAGNGNSMEAQKAIREKRKADAMIALEYIRGKSFESRFPVKTLRRLIFELRKDELAQKAMELLHKSDEKGTQSEAKRQRLTQPVTRCQNSIVSLLRSKSVSSEEKTEESGENHQADNKAIEEYPLEETDLLNALKSTSDPAKLFLDESMALCPTNPEGSCEFKLLITSANCSLLLDELKNLSPQIEHMVRTDAKKLAVYWKDKVSKSKSDELEVVCFLQFLGIFGIVSEFHANDLLSLLNNASWRTTSPDLCQFLGLTNAIPGFIQNLIKTGHRLRAIDYIYSLDMVHRFQPISSIINDFLRITKESAEKMFRDAKNESASQVAAIDRQIKSLRAAIRCISDHKLESDFQISNLEGQIKSLLKARSKLKTPSNGSGSEPKKSTFRNLVEVSPVNSNPPLEISTASVSNSLSKPQWTKEKKRGQKRGLSGNKERSVSLQHIPHTYVTSHPRNHLPVRSYSLSQRLTWPEDHRYNNQRTQSEVSQSYYHYHQPLDPFYRNNF